MIKNILLLTALAISFNFSPAFGCESFEECMKSNYNPGDIGSYPGAPYGIKISSDGCARWFNPKTNKFYKDGAAGSAIYCESWQPNYTKAIAYKLEEIREVLDRPTNGDCQDAEKGSLMDTKCQVAVSEYAAKIKAPTKIKDCTGSNGACDCKDCFK